MSFTSRGLGIAALAAFGLTLTSSARAQQTSGFAINRFDPADTGGEWFTTSSLDFRGTRPSFGIVSDWAYKPLVLRDTTPNGRTVLISDQLTAHFGTRVTLFDRASIGVNMPVAFYANSDKATYQGVTYPAARSDAGDLRLSGDLLLFGAYGAPVSVSAGAALYVPTGAKAAYSTDGNVRVTPRLMAAGDVGLLAYSARFGLAVRPLDDRFESSKLGSELVAGGALGARLFDRKLLVGPELSFGTVLDGGDARTTPVELLFAGHVRSGEFLYGFGVGPGLTQAYGTPDVRSVLSVEWVPGPDTDGDGVRDDADACPSEPGVRARSPRMNGCPHRPPPPRPPRDFDHDGIPDRMDACPRTPGVPQPDRRRYGCPLDSDSDGVFDMLDACPTVAGVASADPNRHGCPVDRDGDGIADADDACVDVSGVRSDDPKRNGCPADSDGDGVLDTEDACPNAAGSKDPDPKKNGCPAARVEAGQIRITEQVKFKTGSAEILKDSDGLLTAVRDVLVAHPEITKLRVEGHTDNRGNPVANKDLSKRRAASVVAWLTAHGIDKARLAPAGFGQEKPIAPNDTEQGRNNNRRVELHIESAPAEKR